MDRSVRYLLREPFFISSRLMPAVRVGDSIIHMGADAVEVEDGDEVVRWDYVIDAPTVRYAATDVYTAYLGHAAIPGQLSMAMGGLLAGLSDVTDAADPDLFPPEVSQWARGHADDLSMVLDSIEHPGQGMPLSEQWRALTDDPYQTPYGRWCAAQAVAHADRLATLAPLTASVATTGLAVRDDSWHRAALGWYGMLADQPEPLPEPGAVCVVAGRPIIEGWLAQSPPGLVDADIQEPEALRTLIDQAQRDGLFGIPHHTIRLHTVVDHPSGPDATLITIQTPSGAIMAAGPIATDALTDGPTGRGDEVTALRNCAEAVSNAFTEGYEPARPGRSRPFPPLGADQATTPTISSPWPEPLIAVAAPPHVHGR